MGFKIQHPTQLIAMESQSLSYLLIVDQFQYHLLQVRPRPPLAYTRLTWSHSRCLTLCPASSQRETFRF